MNSLKKIIYFTVISRFFYFAFATFVYSKFSQLGDTEGYLQGAYLYRNDLTSTAYIMSLLGSTLGSFGSALLTVFLSSFSIIYLYFKLDKYLQLKGRIVFFLTIMTPSFGTWTSIYSKESFLLFFFSLSVGALIDLCENKRVNLFFIAFTFLIVTFMKPHYSICLYSTLLVIYLDKLGIRGIYFLILTIICTILACLFAWSVSEEVYHYTQLLANSYFINGASTRNNDFWLGQFDFFTYAPIGIIKSFIGPTFLEALNRLMFMPYFFEGLFILISVTVLSFKSIFYNSKLNALHLAIFLSFTLVLLFSHYPVGILNPGSSIRYRSGFIFPLMCFVLFLANRNSPTVKVL